MISRCGSNVYKNQPVRPPLYMQGLKINITLTLSLLLATGMLLINALMTALWQHAVIKKQIQDTVTILETISPELKHGFYDATRILRPFINTKDDSCAAILKLDHSITPLTRDCLIKDELELTLRKAIQTRNTTKFITGTTWPLFPSHNTYLHLAIPVKNGHSVYGAIGITRPLQSIWSTILQDQKIIMVYILANTIILTVIGFFRIAYLVIRPIDRLINETSNYRGVTATELTSDIQKGEFSRLSSAINSMIQHIESDKINLQQSIKSLEKANEQIRSTQQELIRTEKLASVGRLSAGLAHEIGNPLGIVLGYLELLQQKELTLEEKNEYIERSKKELNRINLLVRQLLDFSKPLPSETQPEHIHNLLQDTIDMLQAQKPNSTIVFKQELQAENDMVQCNRDALNQAFMNYYLNALDAIHESTKKASGTIHTLTENITDKNKDIIQITIKDNGAGIPPEHLPYIFDPFFTTKDTGKGTGLGLSVSYTIIESTAGTVRIESEEKKGATVIIELPTLPSIPGDRNDSP